MSLDGCALIQFSHLAPRKTCRKGMRDKYFRKTTELWSSKSNLESDQKPRAV